MTAAMPYEARYEARYAGAALVRGATGPLWIWLTKGGRERSAHVTSAHGVHGARCAMGLRVLRGLTSDSSSSCQPDPCLFQIGFKR